MVGGVRVRQMSVVFEWDLMCRVSLNASVSFLCVEMRRRRIDLSGRAYVVLLTELLGERGAHDSAADAGGGREVRLARLSSGGRQSCGGRGSVWESMAASIAAAHTGVDLGHLVGIWASPDCLSEIQKSLVVTESKAKLKKATRKFVARCAKRIILGCCRCLAFGCSLLLPQASCSTLVLAVRGFALLLRR